MCALVCMPVCVCTRVHAHMCLCEHRGLSHQGLASVLCNAWSPRRQIGKDTKVKGRAKTVLMGHGRNLKSLQKAVRWETGG